MGLIAEAKRIKEIHPEYKSSTLDFLFSKGGKTDKINLTYFPKREFKNCNVNNKTVRLECY